MEFSTSFTAAQLAQSIRQRQVSAVDALEFYLERIARLNPKVNAVVTLDVERARARARAADDALSRGELWGPLHGVPVTFKDSLETAGVRTVCGADFLADYVPEQNATAVAQTLAAGAILLGKSNVPPMLDGADTDNPVFGATRNPWNLAHTAGMSSGGSAAALAAGLTPLDIASDMSGSIRLPAHFCGVFGLKPTQHRISRAGHIPPMRSARYVGNPLAALGPMARSVADLTLAFQVLAGAADPDYPETLPMPVGEAQNDFKEGLRLSWCDQFGDLPVTAETRETLGQFVERLASSGVKAEKRTPARFDFQKSWSATGVIFGYTIASSMSEEVRQDWVEAVRMGAEDPAAGPFQRGMLDGARFDAQSCLNAQADRLHLIREMNAFLADCGDGWLCPAACCPAPPSAQAGQPVTVGGQSLAYGTALFGYVSVFNLTGHPAVSLPAAMSADGLPIGFQLVGQSWREMELLAAAGRLCPGTAPIAENLEA